MHFPRIPIRIQGIDLTYLERPATGVSTLPPLLFLHGIVSSAEGFTSLIDQIPNRHVIALNLPGIPHQNHPRDSSLAGLATLVHCFIQKLSLLKPILLGHSHGGAIAMQYALDHPLDLSGLVLLCPAHPFLLRERPLIAFYNSWPGKMAVRCFRFMPKTLHGIGFRRLLGPAGRKTVIDFRPYRSSLLDADIVREVQITIRTWNSDMNNLQRGLEATPITLPTLFLWGDSDNVVPLQTAAPLRGHFANSRLEILPGVGHLPNDEATTLCAQAILRHGEQLEMEARH